MAVKDNVKQAFSGKSTKLLLAFAVILVGGAFAYTFVLGGSQKQVGGSSQVTTAPSVGKSAPGSGETTQEYKKARKQENEKQIQRAKEQGGSAIATPVFGEVRKQKDLEDLSFDTSDKPAKEKPSSTPEPEEAKETKETVKVDSPQEAEQPTRKRVAANGKVVQAMRKQMQTLLDASKPSVAKTTVVTTPQPDRQASRNANRSAPSGSAQSQQTNGSPATASSESSTGSEAASERQKRVRQIKQNLPLPGEVIYAEMISEANSDAPGPVVARVLEGPYSGARVLGSFTKKQDALVIQFNRMTIPSKDTTVPISAYAVNTDNVGTHMATEVDRHIWGRVATAFTLKFIEGVSEAVTQSGSTVVVNRSGETVAQSKPKLDTEEEVMAGVGAAAGETSEIIEQVYGNQPVTVRVSAGTPIGLMFVE